MQPRTLYLEPDGDHLVRGTEYTLPFGDLVQKVGYEFWGDQILQLNLRNTAEESIITP
jgi:hypothetical protein